MMQRPVVEMILRLEVTVNSFRFIGRTPEFQIGLKALCTTSGPETISVEWVVYKSFEECQVFDIRMRATGNAAEVMKNVDFVPLYKAKTFFGQSSKPAFLVARQRDLQEYFTRILSIPGLTLVHSMEGSHELAEFFNIHAHVVFESRPRSIPSYTTQQSSSRSSQNECPPLSIPVEELPIDTPRCSDESDENHLSPEQQQELQALIIQRVEDHSGSDALKAFQKRARRFGKALDAIDVEGASFYHFLVETFGHDFCQWLVPSLAALLPDQHKRQALTNAMMNQVAPSPSFPPNDDSDERNNMSTRLPGRMRPSSEAAIPSSRLTRPQRSRPQSLNAKQVLAKVRDLVDGDEVRVEEFRHMTKELRSRRTSAAEYSAYVVHSFGSDVSKDVLVSVAGAMTDNQIQDDLHLASEQVNSLRGSIHRQRELQRRKSIDRQSQSSLSRNSSLSYSVIEEDDKIPLHNEAPPVEDNRILSRLRNQGAINLMSFK